MITSTSNVQMKEITALLKKSKERKEKKAFVIEGRKMFEEICQDKTKVIKAYFAESYVNAGYAEEAMKEVPYEIVADSVFNSMAETVTPQGVLAIVRMPEYSLEDMISDAGTLVLLENLRDPGNLGTIIRTAEAAGVSGVILSKESVDIYNPKVIRSTMGAVYRVPFLYVDDFLALLQDLRAREVRLLAAHLKGKKTFDKADYSGKVGILIGNEANGLSEEASELANEKVLIPMAGSVESLNAAVAAALLMYEAFRNQKLS
ncbi:MAG: RNA methyltransferase [Lachnospiraceae bacterium]|nr:RNA methyltransferase [Lachnospiraceae bacterium]MBP3578211.1 RNA methyltransferase [Lachnospiraceae bacterium]